MSRNSIDLTFDQRPSFAGTTNKRDSWYLDHEMLNGSVYRTEFIFLNWIGYPKESMEMYSVVSSFKTFWSEKKIVLKYNASGKQRVLMLLIEETETTPRKNLSIVTFTSLEMFDVIDGIMNNWTIDPPGLVYLSYGHREDENWEELHKNKTLVTWGIAKSETQYAQTTTLTCDTWTDLPKWIPSRIRLT